MLVVDLICIVATAGGDVTLATDGLDLECRFPLRDNPVSDTGQHKTEVRHSLTIEAGDP
jgi:hypothetical protein